LIWLAWAGGLGTIRSPEDRHVDGGLERRACTPGRIDPEDPVFHSLFDVQTIFSKIPGIPGVRSGLFDDTQSLFTWRHKT
jgi:hypothetical protein